MRWAGDTRDFRHANFFFRLTNRAGKLFREKRASTGIVYEKHRMRYPTIVLEVGIFESLEDLKEDAVEWLSFTRNEVQIVILVKLQVAEEEKYDPAAYQGFVEVYERDQAGNVRQRGQRKVCVTEPLSFCRSSALTPDLQP